MEIRHLKLIETVAREGTLTKAAESLFLTQSALSHQLKEIEDVYGILLFRRVNRRMVLTPAGQRVLDSAVKILDEIEKTISDLKNFGSESRGELRISTECYTCYHWLPALLRPFNKKFPGVDVSIVAEATHYPIEYLLKGRLDLAIVSGREYYKNLTYEKIFDDEMVAIAPKGHAFERKKFVTGKDFAHQNVIIYPLDINESTLFRKVILPSGVMPAKVLKVQLTEAIIEMVKAGLGVSALAEWAVKPYLESGDLVKTRLSPKGLVRTWYAVTLNEKKKPNYIKEFISYLSIPPAAHTK
jgi:LysR family transcriptional regulator for metE and metH